MTSEELDWRRVHILKLPLSAPSRYTYFERVGRIQRCYPPSTSIHRSFHDRSRPNVAHITWFWVPDVSLGHRSPPPWHRHSSFPSSYIFGAHAIPLQPVSGLPTAPPNISWTYDQLGTWDQARALANATTAQLALDEKVGILIGKGIFGSRCVGDTNPVSRLNIPNFCMNDGPAG